ncbi:glucose 1-dehydrogenase [Haloglomus litoreum]|uniref:glucose 1-dehydrogenase n=1 Tax=Haloglomus litoreum TaxID=3034026 RepID=UPI0023E7E88E|nr:glucose 1-dehydrogenase [Haloglomus sp. DT116]
MHAIGIERGKATPQLLEVPRPEPDEGEALVRTLRVGIDGTDHEVIGGGHGGFPPGEDHLVLGHEAVGVVEEPGDTAFTAGDVVAPTVRRPPPSGSNEYFERGEADMAPPEACVERGIDGAHGFMAEYFTSPAQFLVRVPDDLAQWGFLLEPLSISEKALELAAASRSTATWAPDTVLVLGNGSLGLLTVAMLDDATEVYCLGRRDRPHPTIELLDSLGATYVDSRETPVDEFAAVHEPVDLVYEATGYARHAFECIEALAPGGVAALLGVPGDWTFEVDGGRLHRELVMGNRALVGSVNSGPRHFEAAIDRLRGLPAGFLEDYVTDLVPYREFERAFEEGDDGGSDGADGGTVIKTAVEFDTHEER